jgi:subtilase family serine protease
VGGALRTAAWQRFAGAIVVGTASMLAGSGLAASGLAAPGLGASGLAASGLPGSRELHASGSRSPAAPGAVRVYPDVRVLRSGRAPDGALTPDQIRAAYDTAPLFRRHIDGAGQTIVIVDSFGSPTIRQDLATFDRYFHLPAPPAFHVIHPAGPIPRYRGTQDQSGWAGETTLDVEWAHVMAPDARIILVETPTSENEGTTGFPQIVTAETYVLRHRLGQVISQSFAATEQTFPSRESLLRLRSAYVLAARDHVTVLAASGDGGATSLTYNMQNYYTTRAVSWPATDPLVTAVGGTQLDLRANGQRRAPDVAWSGSGGGRSIFFARPSYQNGVGSLTGRSRGVPDISMDASCASGVAIYASFGGRNAGGWDSICGTSAATPLLAGLIALADQVAGHPLGLINPSLYAMAAAHDPGIVDITRGNNTATFAKNGKVYTVPGFAAQRGYDLVSGVGTINAADFVPELARAPASPSPGQVLVAVSFGRAPVAS